LSRKVESAIDIAEEIEQIAPLTEAMHELKVEARMETWESQRQNAPPSTGPKYVMPDGII
jgi:hypothetical protein